jgi:hypothetical protein
MQKTLSILIIVFSSISGFFIGPLSVRACSCVDGGPEAVFSRADVVFKGTVANVEEVEISDPRFSPHTNYFTGRFEAEPPIIVDFNFQKFWKGDEGLENNKSGKVVSVYNGASCTGYFFKEGESYLVYAKLASDGTIIQESLCSGTGRLDQVEDYLVALEGSVISGSDPSVLNLPSPPDQSGVFTVSDPQEIPQESENQPEISGEVIGVNEVEANRSSFPPGGIAIGVALILVLWMIRRKVV